MMNENILTQELIISKKNRPVTIQKKPSAEEVTFIDRTNNNADGVA